MTGYIYDASFGHAQITPAAMTKGSADGVIEYAGSRDPRKNVTKAEMHALLDAGFTVGLVIENVATDAIGGAPVGTEQGRSVVAAAKLLGYDVDNCVLFGGYDTDAHEGDYRHLLAYMEAFAVLVPVPGYYGDSDSIDYLHARHPGWIYWQSDSRSFSPRNPTPNAHLLQLFNDPRAHGLPVDVNDVKRTPLHLMGEDMPLTDAEIAKIVKAVLDTPFTDTGGVQKDQSIRQRIVAAQAHALDADEQSTAAATQVKAVAAAVAKLAAGGTVPIDSGAVADLVVSKMGQRLV